VLGMTLRGVMIETVRTGVDAGFHGLAI